MIEDKMIGKEMVEIEKKGYIMIELAGTNHMINQDPRKNIIQVHEPDLITGKGDLLSHLN